MKTLIAIMISLLGVSTEAHAWGQREQGALAGAAGVILLQHMLKDRSNQNGYPPVYSGQPMPQQPQVVYQQPQQPPIQVIISDGFRGQERVCRTVQIWDPSGQFYYGDRRECGWVQRY
jgi:hypothetical protein